jgi:hypothetical protein
LLSRSEAPRIHLDQPAHLVERLWIVVDLQAKHDVVVQPDAAVLLDDQHRGRLLAPRISASGLSCIERRHQAQREMAGGLLEGLHHPGHHRFTGEDVPLCGAELPALVPGPLRRLRAGVRGVVARRVHDRELPARLRPGPAVQAGVGVTVEDLLDDRIRLDALAQQRERLRTVADVDDCLRSGHARIGLGPENAVAYRKHTRLHGPADLTGGRVVAEDREGAGKVRLLGRRLPSDEGTGERDGQEECGDSAWHAQV